MAFSYVRFAVGRFQLTVRLTKTRGRRDGLLRGCEMVDSGMLSYQDANLLCSVFLGGNVFACQISMRYLNPQLR